MNAKIRQMSVEDWKFVRLIYLEGIATGEATFETSAPSWEEWDTSHLRSPRLVATLANNGQIKGWSALSRVSQRAVYAGVAEVSVYVGSDARGKGLGKVLLKQLIDESELNGIWTLQAGIFPENEVSIALHKSFGFRMVGTRERIGKLNGIWRDTVLLERRSKVIGVE